MQGWDWQVGPSADEPPLCMGREQVSESFFCGFRDDFYSLPRPIDLDELQGDRRGVRAAAIISALASAFASDAFRRERGQFGR